MSYRLLYIFVEGDDDERFFNTIAKPSLDGNNYWVEVRKYREGTPRWVNKFIRSIKSMRGNIGADYIFTGDIDEVPCVTEKKENLKREYKRIEKNRIIIIIKEIESWYLAGVDESYCKRLRIPFKNHTNDICKEDFCSLVPRRFDSKVDFMVETLKSFNITLAKTRNKSLRYFADKYL